MHIFIFRCVVGILCAGALGFGIFCYTACKKRNEYGLLSQNIKFYEEFRDTGKDEEKELFSRPTESKCGVGKGFLYI